MISIGNATTVFIQDFRPQNVLKVLFDSGAIMQKILREDHRFPRGRRDALPSLREAGGANLVAIQIDDERQ